MAKLLLLSAFLVVVAATIIQAEADGGGQKTLRRQKREWIIPPRKLMENIDYTLKTYSNLIVAKIRSDEETRTSIRYSLIGHGADAAPVNLFTVDERTGIVRVHGILDREEIHTYYLRGVAKFQNGSKAEKDIDLQIEVMDENDNDPVFNVQPTGSVFELSSKGTYVLNIIATDADQEQTLHSMISYGIVEPNPPEACMFYINQKTGNIYVQNNTLNREMRDTYTLTIKATDMNGQPGGRTTTAKVTINILDVNDNVPVLEKEFYEGSVEENIRNVEVVRIKAIDHDLIHTDNWRAVYKIIQGNEAGYFDITTDNETNEGILIIKKHVDYEELKEVNLRVIVSNVAKYHSSVKVTESKSYPIKIKVINQPEGPRFHPSVKVISISEDSTTINLKKIIATYTAIDSDTLKTIQNVRYVKGEDADNWLIIDEKTAEIRLNKFPDRESKFLHNGTYYAKILCITNAHPTKTATGTIAIQVEDFNDHCPTLTSPAQTICYGDSILYATAVDGDNFPNGEPFEFKVVTKSTKEKWSIEHLNETTAILRSQEILWPGHYTVGLEVQDQQGKFCSDGQDIHLSVCTCDEAKVCIPKRRTGTAVKFGAAGVLAMLLGLLLLLLIPLLMLFCVCGGAAAIAGFKPFPADQAQHFMSYHTEGQGEDKKIPLLPIPTELDSGGQLGQQSSWGKGQQWNETWGGGGGGGGGEGASGGREMFNTWEEWYYHQYGKDFNSNMDSSMAHKKYSDLQGLRAFEGIALSEAFLGSYYSKKLKDMTGQAASDSLLTYEFEGDGASLNGSFEDICSHLNEGNDLAFLNDLGPQFKTLAELCHGSAIDVEVSSVTKLPVRKPAPTGVDLGIRQESTMGASHAGASSSTHASASASASASTSASTSASSTHITATDYHQSSSTSGAGVLTHNVPSQTLLIQQPSVYYTTTPVYVVDPTPQPTLLVAATPMMGMQENVVLVEQRGADFAKGVSTLGLKQTHNKVLVDKTSQLAREAAIVEASGPQVLLGRSEIGSGSVQFVESGRVQTLESLRPRQGSSISEGQSFQLSRGLTGTQNGLTVTQHDVPLLTVPHSGTHQKVREERISVVEKSFQSSSAT
ncbi:hypothetical protein AOLI_G00105800 [Acnodon oligacanthus]